MGPPKRSPAALALAITVSAALVAACSASDAGDVVADLDPGIDSDAPAAADPSTDDGAEPQVASATDGDAPADVGSSIEPEMLRLGQVVPVNDFVGFAATVSPDGRWFAHELDREICLSEIVGDVQICEAYPYSVGNLDWHPESTSVIVSSWPEGHLVFGPVVMIGTDGSSEALLEPPPDDDTDGRRFEGPYRASFLPDGTVVYNELRAEAGEWVFRLMHLTPDGTEELADYRELWSTDDERPWPFIEVVSEAGVLVLIDYGFTDSGRRAETHRFDLESRSFDRIEDDSIEYGDWGDLPLHAVSASADHLVMLADEAVRLGFARRAGDPPIVFLVDLDDGSRVPVPFPVDGYVVGGAVLSPSGSLLAVEARYGGDDREVRDSDEGCLLAVVDVSSVMDGDPRWVEPVLGLGRCSGRQMSDRLHGLVWAGETQIMVNGQLGLRRIDIDPGQPG